MREGTGRTVLCGANAYERKYYFNPRFDTLPDPVKEELHIICVLFTRDAGGIFTVVLEEDGSVSMETSAKETDFGYDEIAAGLLVSEIRRKRQALFELLSLYGQVFSQSP
ncbi:MAG: DUF6145 family protein [Clostridium sp.]|jgi:hypothetical protein|nr:DUF6145 family protein [Clostridium sp.]